MRAGLVVPAPLRSRIWALTPVAYWAVIRDAESVALRVGQCDPRVRTLPVSVQVGRAGRDEPPDLGRALPSGTRTPRRTRFLPTFTSETSWNNNVDPDPFGRRSAAPDLHTSAPR